MPLTLLATYVRTGLPEEILFRGVIHELCEVRLRSGRLAILASSLIFGAAHLNNEPAPNVRYAALAAAAGYFYARAYLLSDRNVSAAALTHALVDTVWSLLLRLRFLYATAPRIGPRSNFSRRALTPPQGDDAGRGQRTPGMTAHPSG